MRLALIPSKEFKAESNHICNPLPRRLADGPEFEVLYTIVCPNSIQVMYGLPFMQWSTESLAHDNHVLWYLPVLVRVGMARHELIAISVPVCVPRSFGITERTTCCRGSVPLLSLVMGIAQMMSVYVPLTSIDAALGTPPALHRSASKGVAVTSIPSIVRRAIRLRPRIASTPISYAYHAIIIASI